MGNDDLFLIFYNFCCNCTFYMRSKYVGGMVWQFFIKHARSVYAPKTHKHPIFKFGRILAFLAKKYFASNVPYVCRYLAITLGYESPTPDEFFDRHFTPSKNSKIFDFFVEKSEILGGFYLQKKNTELGKKIRYFPQKSGFCGFCPDSNNHNFFSYRSW